MQNMKGRITTCFWNRGYAFLRDVATGQEVFVHMADVVGQLPQKGDFVSFTVGSFAGREKAIEVTVLRLSARDILCGADEKAGAQ